MILRHGRCRGIRLFRRGQKQLELWFAPHNEVILTHVHPHIDSTLVFLGGRMVGRIGNRWGPVGALDFLRCFCIPANVPHSAVVTGWFALFLNWETWKEGANVTSAAVDFQAA